MLETTLSNQLNLHIEDVNGEDFFHVSKKLVSSFNIPHRMEILNSQGPVDISINYLTLPNSSITYFNYRSETLISIDSLFEHYVVEIPLSGVADTWIGKNHFRSYKGWAVVISPGSDFAAKWSADCTKLLIIIDRKKLEYELSNIIDKALRKPIQFDMGLNLNSSNGKSFTHTVQYILQEFRQFDDPSAINIYTCRQLEKLLISSLILNQQSNYSSELRIKDSNSSVNFIQDAERYIKSHFKEPITTGDISKAVGTSQRNLSAAFRKYRGVSPISYVTNLRYENVHKALRKAEPEDTVSRIAMEYGFYQLGRFSAEYKNRYGELPSATLKKT